MRSSKAFRCRELGRQDVSLSATVERPLSLPCLTVGGGEEASGNAEVQTGSREHGGLSSD